MKNRVVLMDKTNVELGTSTVSATKVLKVDVVQTVGGSGGSGTEYAEGSTQATVTAGSMLAKNASNVLYPLQLDASKYLLVNGSNVTQPVSGTFWQATQPVSNAGTFAVQAAQSGTWTVQPGNTANTTAWKVDGSAVTQPVSGAVTATIAAGATTIAKAEDSASADADVGVPALAVRKATPANTSGTDGDYEFLQISAGRLWISAVIDTALPAGANAIGKLAANSGVTIGAVEIAAAQTLATVTTVSTVTSLTQMNGQAISMGTGVRAAGTQRVTIATDDVVPASQSGTWNIGTVTTVTGVTTVSTVTAVTSITNDVNVKRKPDATSTFAPTNLDSTALEASHVIKASAGTLYSVDVYNSDSVAYYIQLFNSTTVPADTTAPTIAPIKIAPDSNISLSYADFGRFFSTGIAICGSTTAATKTVAGAKFWFSARYA